MKKFLLLAALITVSAPMCLSLEAEEEDERQVPAMLQVCSEELWEREETIAVEPWWLSLIVEIKDKYPGYCLMALKVFPVAEGVAVVYGVKSPDGKTILNDSMTYSNLLTAN